MKNQSGDSEKKLEPTCAIRILFKNGESDTIYTDDKKEAKEFYDILCARLTATREAGVKLGFHKEPHVCINLDEVVMVGSDH